MNILEIIDDATKEYAANGRSEEFIAMEDQIINSKKMAQIYWFARYVKGADIDKLQTATLKSGTMLDGFYFAKYVNGSDIQQFLQKAIDSGDRFWVHKIVSLTASPFNNRKEEIIGFKSQLSNFGIDITKTNDLNRNYKKCRMIKGLISDDIDRIIEKRNQLDAITTTGAGADVFLYAKHVPGANIKELERSLIMHGNAYNMILFAEHITGANHRKLLTGIELALRDYVAIEARETKKVARISDRKRALKAAIAAGKSEREIYNLRVELREAEFAESYLTEVNRYKRKMQYLMADDNYGRK